MSFSELCGLYAQDCRPSHDGNQNVRATFSLLGNSYGVFEQAYDYFSYDDVTCSRPHVSSYHISGTYALHGPSDCAGKCQVRLAAWLGTVVLLDIQYQVVCVKTVTTISHNPHVTC